MFKLSDFFIILSALVSFFLSAWLWFTGKHEEGIFTALWVPGILCFGIYAKVLGIIYLNERKLSDE